MRIDDVEATVWQQAPVIAGPDPAAARVAMRAVLDAVLANARRGRGRPATIAEMCDAVTLRRIRPAPVTHWQKPAAHPNTAACHGKQTTGSVTSDRGAVTCGSCLQSRLWKVAA